MKATTLRSILGATAAVAALSAGAAQAAAITVFKQPHFTGDKLTLRENATDLNGAGFEDQISSIVVHSGRWQFCSQPGFNGDCIVLGPGEYPQLAQDMNHRIESARELSRYAREGRYRGREFTRNRHGGPAVVELFPGPDFRGRPLRLDGDDYALNDRGFEGGVSSLVVHEGRWQVCTRPGFQGRCRIFEPGRYADLRRFDNRIASMRRIG